jgi:hypothetical protein
MARVAAGTQLMLGVAADYCERQHPVRQMLTVGGQAQSHDSHWHLPGCG